MANRKIEHLDKAAATSGSKAAYWLQRANQITEREQKRERTEKLKGAARAMLRARDALRKAGKP